MLIDRPVVTDEGDTVGESDFKSRISWEVSPGGHSPSVDVKSTFQIGPKTLHRPPMTVSWHPLPIHFLMEQQSPPNILASMIELHGRVEPTLNGELSSITWEFTADIIATKIKSFEIQVCIFFWR